MWFDLNISFMQHVGVKMLCNPAAVKSKPTLYKRGIMSPPLPFIQKTHGFTSQSAQHKYMPVYFGGGIPSLRAAEICSTSTL